MRLSYKIILIAILTTLLILFASCANLNTTGLSNESSSRDITNIDYTTETTTYWVTTDKTITVSWDAISGASTYNVVIQWIRGTKVLQTYSMGSTTELTTTMSLPRVGTFVIGIQGVDSSGTLGEFCYSNDSTCSTVNSSGKAWVIEGYLPSVTGGTIE